VRREMVKREDIIKLRGQGDIYILYGRVQEKGQNQRK
jgi:hypothetical protein